MAEMFLQAQAAFVTGAPALQCDVGVQRTVARAHSGVAADPITGDEMRRVRSDGAHPADCPGSRYHRQVQQVFALAAERPGIILGLDGPSQVSLPSVPPKCPS